MLFGQEVSFSIFSHLASALSSDGLTRFQTDAQCIRALHCVFPIELWETEQILHANRSKV